MSVPLPSHYQWLVTDESVQVTLISHQPYGSGPRTIVRVDRSEIGHPFEPAVPGQTTAVIDYDDSLVRIDGHLFDLGDNLFVICGIADSLFEGKEVPQPGETADAYR